MNSEEIARLANVSRATVSRVMNGHPNVSEKTRKKIEKIIREHNYFPDTSARSLAGVNSRFIGLFIIDFTSEHGEYTVSRSTFFYEFVGYAIDVANKYRYNLVTTIIHRDNIDDIDRLFQSHSIAGGIILGDLLDQKTLAHISASGYPIVLCHQIRYSPSPNIVTVNLDNFRCGRMAGEELVRHGHKKIAHITGEARRMAVQDRLDGFVSALTASGISYNQEKYVFFGEFYRRKSAYEGVKALLERCRDDLPTAMFITSSMLQVGALNAIREAGLRVPEDISIIGMGELDAEIYTTPPLSEVFLGCEKFAAAAVSRLLESIENPSPQIRNHIISEWRLISRGSIQKL